jgi:NADPH:quinone reductase
MRHKRVVVTHYGGPEVITIIEEDIPTPKAGEVRVKVLAAGVSLPDVLSQFGIPSTLTLFASNRLSPKPTQSWR